nr:MAG TPA: tail protein [Caudoviricetes sp.]
MLRPRTRTFKGSFTCRWAPSDGEDGKDGVGIKSADVVFCLSTSGTTPPADNAGWVTLFKDLQLKENTYVWSCTKTVLTNGTTSYTGKQCLGASKDFVSILELYALSSSGTTAPTSGWETTYKTEQGKWLWTKNRMQWTNGSFTYTTPVCIGHFAKDGENGMDGAYTDYSYNISKNKTSKNSSTAPTDCYYSTWQDAPIATTETYPFLWMRMERKNDASDKSVSYVCVTGDKGDKGDKGDPGDNGTDGNGIASQESLFVATDKKVVATYGSVSGWSNIFPQPTEQKPYVWKCVKTTFTKKADSYSTPELVTIYQSGANGNILRNASFTDGSNMEAWVTQSQYNMASGSAPIGDGGGIDTKNKLHGHNSYFDRCSGVSGAANYKDVLVQTVHHPNGGLNNIVNGLWYTLSFWAKRAVNVITLNKAVSATSYATANVYLKAGVRYAIRVQSTVSSASYPITTTVTPNGTSVAALTIKQTASGSKTDYLTPSTSGIHAIRSIVSGGTGTVISYAADDSRDLSTYLAPSLVDTSSKIYVDGEERTPSADLGVVWSLASGWSFHTLTFKAAASLTASVKQQLFFRLDSVPHVDLWRKVWICEPKLESGMMYTGYVDSSEDLKGIPGLIVRTTEWAAGVEYHNDENLTGGIRYLDVAMVTNSKTGLVNMFQCRKTHVSTDANKPQAGVATAEWKTVNMERMPIYTPLIIADNAVLRFGQTNRMLIMDTEGKKIQGCVTGVDDPKKPMAWFGGETAGVSNTSISYDGKLKSKDGYFEGTVAGVQGSFSKLYGGYWDNGTLKVNDKAYIEFSERFSSLAIHGNTYMEGDEVTMYSKNFYHMTSGLNGEKPARLITQNVWCGGSFGAARRVTVVISMNKATYYLSGTDEILYQRDARELLGTLIGDKTVYQIECCPPYIKADDLKNVIVDTVIFDGANTTDMYYYLELRATQRVMVISANNTPRYKTYLYITGKLWNLEGGYAMFVTMLPGGLLKPSTKGLGADQLVCGAYDNNW